MRSMSGRRIALIATLAIAGVVALVAVVLFAVRGGFEPKVRAETGTRVVCTNGEVVSDNIHTIEVPASQAGNYGVKTSTITCAKHLQAAKLYAEAQALIAKGDLKGAGTKLAEVVAIDPGYRSAAQQLADIKAGRKPTGDSASGGSSGGGGGGGSSGGSGGPSQQLPEGLARYVPDTLAGYKAQPIVADPLVLTRQYTPVSRPKVGSLVIVAEQFKNADSATAHLKNDIKSSYPSDASGVPAGGKTAYFGTDGRRFAVVAVNFGGILVVIEGSVKSGDPASLKGELAAIAAAVTK